MARSCTTERPPAGTAASGVTVFVAVTSTWGESTVSVAAGVAGVALPASFAPSMRAVCVKVPVPGSAGTASAATSTRNGTAAVAPIGMAPRNSTAKPVMRAPPVSVGVAGSPAPAASSTGAGVAPLETVQVTVASVAPSGHAAPEVRKPPKVTSSVRNAPAGCATVSAARLPLEALRPVTVETVQPPAGMRAVENAVAPETAEVSPPIVYVAEASASCVPWFGTATLPRTFAVIVAPVMSEVPPRVAARCARSSTIDPAEPFATSCAPAVDEAKRMRRPRTSAALTPGGRAGVAARAPSIHAEPSQTSTRTRSAPCGIVTAPNPTKSTDSKRLLVAAGSVGARSVRVSARAFEVLRVVSVRVDASPTLNCVVGGAQVAEAAVATVYGTVTVATTEEVTVAAFDAEAAAVFVTPTPFEGQSGESDGGTVRVTWIE